MAGIEAGIYAKLKAMATTTYIFADDSVPQDDEMKYPATIYSVETETDIGRSHDNVVPMREARFTLQVLALDLPVAIDAMETYFSEFSRFDGDLGAGFSDVSIRHSNKNPNPNYKNEAIKKNVFGRSRDFMIIY